MLNKLTGLGKAVFCSRVWLALILMCMAVALLYIFLQFLSYTSMPKIQWEVSFDEISADLFIPSLRQSRSGGYSIVCFPDISKSSGIPVCIVNWDGADVRNCRLLYVEKTNDDNVMESGFVESAEGDIVMCGSVSHHASGATCAWVTKINPEGKTEWLLRGDSSGSAWSCWNDIVEAHDSGFVLAGYKELECGRLRVISVMKIDPNGHLEWERTLGVGVCAMAFMVATTSSGYLVTGRIRSSAGVYDMLVASLGENGQTQWTYSPGLEGVFSSFFAEAGSSGDEYIVGGCSRASEVSGGTRVRLIALDGLGRERWRREFYFPVELYFRHMRRLSCGKYVLAGHRNMEIGFIRWLFRDARVSSGCLMVVGEGQRPVLMEISGGESVTIIATVPGRVGNCMYFGWRDGALFAGEVDL